MNLHGRAIFLGLTIVIASQLMGVLAKVVLRDVPAFTCVWLQLTAAGSF